MVGGGVSSFIGETHRIALRSDGLWDLVAGAFSRRWDISRQTGRSLLIDEKRIYSDYRDLIAGETQRDDHVDAVILATPPSDHLEIGSTLLKAGFHLICEKPISITSEEARVLKQVAEQAGRRILLTNCYSAYPMVRLTRDMVRRGDLGRISIVNVEFASGAYAGGVDEKEPLPWRMDPNELGGLGMLADLGAHVFQMAEFVSNQTISKVAAHLETLAPQHKVIDNAFVDARFSNGAIGRFWTTYQAIGNVHGLCFSIFGDKASLAWDHEMAEVMWLRHKDQPAMQLTKAGPLSSSASLQASRFSAGHADGYGLAFATLYRDFAYVLMSDGLGADPSAFLRDLPSAKAGESSMSVIEAVVSSAAANHAWTEVRRECDRPHNNQACDEL
jgi:predicted dehydrogenase